MIEVYDGADLIDAMDERIGTIERSFVDDRGAVRFVEVSIGTLRGRHRLIPADRLEWSDDAVRAPFTRDVIEASPDVSAAGDTLEGEILDRVRAYYASGGGRETGTIGAAEGIAPRPVDEMRSSPPDASGATPERVPADEAGTGDIGQIRDLGDVIEIPIVEEVLVKRAVVKEVLRIRKSSLTDVEVVEGEVRKEDIEVER